MRKRIERKNGANKIEKNQKLLYASFVIGFLGILLIFGSKNSMAGGTGNYPVPENGDWVIDNETEVWNETIILTGDLMIEDGGNLTFRNVTLMMNCSEDGEFGIEVKDGGNFYIFDYDNNPKTTNDRSNITANNSEYEFKFLVDSGTEFEMRNSEVSQCGYQFGLETDGSLGLTVKTNNSLIDNLNIYNNYYGIIFLYSNNNTIINNNVSNNNRGIWFSSSSNNQIKENHIISNHENGIYLSYSNNNQVTYNNISNYYYNIYLYKSFNNQIEKNICSSIEGLGVGIRIIESDNNSIIDNTCVQHENLNGIAIGGNNNIIRNNICNYNEYGIGVAGENNIIIDNICKYNKAYGLRISSSNSRIINNTCFGGVGAMILEGNNNTISNNSFQNNHNGIVSGLNNNNVISNNNCSDTKWGIVISGNFNNTINDNNLWNNDIGIRISQSTNCSIINNTCINNKHIGIFIEQSSNNYVENNTFSNSEIYGIELYYSDSNLLFFNTISNNNNGIFFQNSSLNKIKYNNINNNSKGIYIIKFLSGYPSENNKIHYNNIYDNSELGIDASENGGVTINATYNWWGDETGPYHPANNSNGKGDEVTDYVDFTPWIGETDEGHLSGFVKDQFNNSLKGVKIKIEYHDTFQETFTDKNGYYLISNIPICFCLKKATASKEGYNDFSTEIGISENTILNITLFEEENKGKLSGYVTDTFNNTLENLKIRIEYHETFQETLTDENGYYSISNIPICECLKKVKVSKEGYKDFTIEIGITENTTLNITLFGEENKGKLTGYVTDTLNDPLENVKIKIEYHETFQEIFSYENGYYSISNIPICFCLKKVTASKDGYYDFEKNISVDENSILNITLEPILLPKPDLIITPNYISFSPPSPIEGNKIRIYATIKNLGNTDAKANATFYLNKISSKNQIGSKQPISVLAGKTDDVYIDWICIPGEYKIYIEITNSIPEESDISNNIAYKTINVQEKIKEPDLTLTTSDIWIEGTPKVKETVKIKARIHNYGDIEAIAKIKIYDGEPKDDNSNLIGFSTISIPPNGNYTITEDWTPLTKGNHTIYVIIENCEPQESNTKNNQATKTVFVESEDKKEKSYIPSSETMAVGATIGVCAIVAFVLIGTEIGLYKLLILVFLPLYFKITRKDIEKRLSEDKFTIGRIFGYIEANPGATYSEIKKSMSLNNGTTAYHLNRLEKTEFVKSRRTGKFKHFYPAKMKIPDGEVTLSQIQQTILRNIEAKPGISQIILASKVGISRQLVNYHLRVLSSIKPPFIKLEKSGRKVRCYLYLENGEDISNGETNFLGIEKT